MQEITWTPFKETRLYKDIADEVRDEVSAERLTHVIERLKRLHNRGALLDEDFQAEISPLEKELEFARGRRTEQENEPGLRHPSPRKGHVQLSGDFPPAPIHGARGLAMSR